MASILIVDDNPTNLKLLKVQLELGQHTVTTAETAHEALGILRAQRPHLLIVDIQMPVMDGYDFARQVRSESGISDTAIVLCTATYHHARAQDLAEALGVQFVLTKPIDPDWLLEVVQRVIGSSARPLRTVARGPEFDRAHFRLVADTLNAKVAEVSTLSERLAKLTDLSLDLNVEHDLPALQGLFGRVGRDLLAVEFVAVGMVGEQGLTTLAVSGGSSGGEAHSSAPDGLLERLSAATDPIVLEDVDLEPRTLGLPQATGSIRAFLGVPVASSTKRYGWMYFARQDAGRPFTIDDRQIAQALAAQFAMAYEHALLFAQVRHHVEVLEARVADRTSALQLSYKALDESRQRELDVKDNFLAHVSHELRSPLAAAHLFLRNLADGLSGELTPRQQDDLGVALRNVDQLRGMIGDLLETTRSDTGRLRVDRHAIAVGPLIAEAVTSFQPGAGTIRLDQQIADNLPEVFADAQRVRQILNNLIDNAIKFTPPGGRISVRAALVEPERAFVRVEVEDTGRGLSPDGTELAFERMYQEQPTADLPRGGLGLGLYICKLLVDGHGGRIWATSTPGAGSAFLFTLPVANAAMAAQVGCQE